MENNIDLDIKNISVDNNIINNIIKYCNKLDESVKYHNNIKAISNYLSELLQLFDSKRETFTIVDKSFIDDCFDLFVGDSKNVTVNIECNDAYKIQYSPIVVKQVLLNIISNAYKYNCENGQISIRLFEDEDAKLYLYAYNTVSNDINICETNKLGLSNCIHLLTKSDIVIENYRGKYFSITICFNM
jgi:signal transduction histidine kinase